MKLVRHHRYRGKIDAYVDNELPDQELLVVARHLDECVDCSAQARLIWNIKRVLWGAGARGHADENVEDLRVFVRNLDG